MKDKIIKHFIIETGMGTLSSFIKEMPDFTIFKTPTFLNDGVVEEQYFKNGLIALYDEDEDCFFFMKDSFLSSITNEQLAEIGITSESNLIIKDSYNMKQFHGLSTI
jgi:hypothetical protein